MSNFKEKIQKLYFSSNSIKSQNEFKDIFNANGATKKNDNLTSINLSFFHYKKLSKSKNANTSNHNQPISNNKSQLNSIPMLNIADDYSHIRNKTSTIASITNTSIYENNKSDNAKIEIRNITHKSKHNQQSKVNNQRANYIIDSIYKNATGSVCDSKSTTKIKRNIEKFKNKLINDNQSKVSLMNRPITTIISKDNNQYYRDISPIGRHLNNLINGTRSENTRNYSNDNKNVLLSGNFKSNLSHKGMNNTKGSSVLKVNVNLFDTTEVNGANNYKREFEKKKDNGYISNKIKELNCKNYNHTRYMSELFGIK